MLQLVTQLLAGTNPLLGQPCFKSPKSFIILVDSLDAPLEHALCMQGGMSGLAATAGQQVCDHPRNASRQRRLADMQVITFLS